MICNSHRTLWRMRSSFALLTMLGLGTILAQADQAGKATLLAQVQIDGLKESSGLAASRSNPGVLWTHNDSGGRPRLFALNQTGQLRTILNIEGAQHVDWEDLCSFQLPGETPDAPPRNYLLIGDVGDNAAMRPVCTLYLVADPVIPGGTKPAELTLKPERIIRFAYPDGPRDCESLAVDVAAKTILLLSKRDDPHGMYTLPLAGDPKQGDGTLNDPLMAKKIISIDLPDWPTAMDLSSDGKVLVVLSFGPAYVWTRTAEESWQNVLARKPESRPMPQRTQGESICFDVTNQKLYLTSEGKSFPLYEVPAPQPQNP